MKLVFALITTYILSSVLAAGIANAEILIAVVGPLSGQNISLGEQVHRGTQLAVERINSDGGVLGEQVRLVVADDSCDSEQAVAVARKLVVEGVVFVDGHVCSHASIPASKVYDQAGILMISPASTNPRLTDEGGATIFRVVGRDDQQGIVAGDYLADAWGAKRIAILHDGSVYGKGLADETRKRLNERGIVETIYEMYRSDSSDYSQLIAQLKAEAIDVVYIGGYGPEAGLILREADVQGLSIQLVGGDSLTTEEFWYVAGPAAEGTLVTFGHDPRREPAAAEVVSQLRAENFEPEGYTLYAYGAVQVWAQAVEMAGTVAAVPVAAVLMSHKFETVLGEIEFDQNGDVTAPAYVWYRWTDGDYVPVE